MVGVRSGVCVVLLSFRYWAFLLAHVCVFDSMTSEVAQAMFCGSYIHGAALFGIEPCFYETAEDDFGEEPDVPV